MRATLAVTAIGMLARARMTRRFVVLLQEVAVEDGQGEQAHQGADSATSLGDLQFHDRQFDDVAFVEGRNAEQRQYVAGDS